MSKTRSQWRNSATLFAPSCNSSQVIAPLLSSSIFSNIFPRTFFSWTSSQSISFALLIMSLDLISAKVSTITATIRFSTPKTSVSKAPVKIMLVHGCNSMTGIATLPQLSPAMMVWNSVMFAWKTLENDLEQRLQSPQPSWSSISCTLGLMSSTARTAQTVMTRTKRRKDQKSVLKQLPIIWISFLSSLSMEKRQMIRRSRKMRHKRITRTVVKKSNFTPHHPRV
mmetsp:Transcript_24565/g.55580  ORF Transcript_24565/g.55580 Transcript_24565/m.55580 type:complete len:225 (-) Transcript_24565:512-1186(-)